jgi:hypothetical protein
MLRFRVEAIARAKDGVVNVLTSHHFIAESADDAERIADDWTKARPPAKATSLRLVRSEMILAERQISDTEWTRSWRSR